MYIQREGQGQQDRAYYNFINSCKSEETRQKYEFNVTNFLKFCNLEKHSELLKINAEEKIIDYIVHLRNQKLSSHTIHSKLTAIYHFYTMNDTLLTKVKINKYKGEFRKVRKDRAYTREEIHKLVDIAGLRMKVCILLMASAGLRVGSIPSIKIKHPERIDKYYLYKITVYENSNEEYYTFCTPECASFIDEYLDYRQRNGEKLTPEAYLIRNEFDSYAPLSLRQSVRGITKKIIAETIRLLMKKTGIDNVGNISLTHGFRKFVNTEMINSDVNLVVKEMLLGHSVGLEGSYYRPTTKKLLDEYLKAVNNLTINEENRLKIKVKQLETDKVNYETLDKKIDELSRQYLKEHISKDPEGQMPISDEEIEYILERRRLTDKVRRKRDKAIIEGMTYDEYRKGKHHDIVL